MGWYSAHAIMYVQLTDGPQDGYQVFENVFIVQAETPDQAHDKAYEVARREEGDCDGSMRLGDRPATLVFGSIRKVVEVSHAGPDGVITDGDEVTYSEYLVSDRAALDRLIDAEDVELLYFGKDEDEDSSQSEPV